MKNTNLIRIASLFAGFFAASVCVAQSNVQGQEFLETTYFEGIPYEEAKFAGQLFWQNYVAVLDDENKQELWSNAVAAIGASGKPGAVEVLMGFIEKNRGNKKLSGAACRALNAVPLSIAFHTRENDDTESAPAIDYLAKLAKGNVTIPWHCAYQGSNKKSTEQLQKLGIQSLGYTAKPVAQQYLIDMDGRSETKAYKGEIKDALNLYDEEHKKRNHK
jgi:hypothetical protein